MKRELFGSIFVNRLNTHLKSPGARYSIRMASQKLDVIVVSSFSTVYFFAKCVWKGFSLSLQSWPS